MTSRLITHLLSGLIMAISITACGGPGDSTLFADVPNVYEEYLKKKEAIIDNALSDVNEPELAQCNDDFDKLFDKYISKMESAAKKWSGTKLAVSSNDTFKIKSSLKVNYAGFVNKTNLTVQYTLKGEIVVTRDIFTEADPAIVDFYRRHPERLKGMYGTLILAGLDEDGAEVIATRIGHIDKELKNDSIGIKAGTHVVLEKLRFKDYAATDYKRINSLALTLK